MLKNVNRSIVKTIFYTRTTELRIVWSLLLLILFVAIGEILLVDSFEKLLLYFGVEGSSIDLPKRVIRILVVGTAAWVVLRFFMKKGIGFVGFTRGKNGRNILLGIGLGFISQIVAVSLMCIMGWYHLEGFSWQFKTAGAISFAVLYALVFCFETGFIEELIFRGFVLNLFAKRHSVTIGVVVSSVLFGVVHFSGFTEEFSWWLSIISSVGAGLLFAQSYLLFNNIWVPISFHAGWHFAMRFFGSPGLAANDAMFLVTSVDGPSNWVATKSGGAGLTEIAGMVVVSLIMFIIKRNYK